MDLLQDILISQCMNIHFIYVSIYAYTCYWRALKMYSYIIWRFPEMGDPQVNKSFNTNSWSNDLDDLGVPPF